MNREQKTVFVGLSGGVDSGVSAALLLREGYKVVGLFARISLAGYQCTAGEDRRDALRVAAHLGIPFEEVDLSEAYRMRVFADMLAGYRRGETPNPDALCNREIKFGLLYDYVRSRGGDFFATGHYARTETAANGETHLLAGVDPEKDQSYFLWMVPSERLAHTLFPVGGLHKTEVRALAAEFGLPNAKRKDSQGLCFLGQISIEEMLKRELRLEDGDVLDEQGKVIGRHHGAALYTVGQRHGFSVPAQDANEVSRMVVVTDVAQNTITVAARVSEASGDDRHPSPNPPHPNPLPGKGEGAAAKPPINSSSSPIPGRGCPTGQVRGSGNITVLLRETNWIGELEAGALSARFRYRQPLMQAELRGTNEVILPGEIALPKGQSLVLYRGERCLGGGIIT